MSVVKKIVDSQKARVVTGESDATKMLVNPYKAKRSTHMDLVELATEVQQSHETVRNVAGGKLQMIAEQIRFLQEQAQRVLEDAAEDAALHNAQCNIVKRPGTIYSLYKRDSGESYFSLLNPNEWRDCPHEFLGCYRLERDHSWTKAEFIAKKDEELQVIDNLMTAKTGLPSIMG